MSMEKVDVSIVVINYNTFDLTCQCVDSIYRHAASDSFEIILVDNASSERDPSDFLGRFPRLNLIKSRENLGFAKGNNLGIGQAKGEYILLLNSDAVLLNDVPAILINFLKEHNDVAAASGRLEYPDGRIQHNCQRFPSVRYGLFELLRLQKVVGKQRGGKILFGAFFDHRSVAFPDWIWGTCFMFRRQLLDELPGGKLADDFFMYGEDVQWCMEFKGLGYRIAFEPEARVLHYMGKSGGAKSALIDANMNILMDKYYSPLEKHCIRLLDRMLK